MFNAVPRRNNFLQDGGAANRLLANAASRKSLLPEGLWVWTISWNPDGPLSEEEWESIRQETFVHAKVEPVTFRPVRNRDNDYGIDREQQRMRGIFDIATVINRKAIFGNDDRAAPVENAAHDAPFARRNLIRSI